MLEALLQDVRHACRHLRSSPGFAAPPSRPWRLALARTSRCSASSTRWCFGQLPIKDPHGLIGRLRSKCAGPASAHSHPAVGELTREKGPLQHVCAYNGGAVIAVEANGAPTQAILASVTGQCFTTFGVTPILGRAIADADVPLTRPGNRVAVIGHRFWTRMFGADPQRRRQDDPRGRCGADRHRCPAAGIRRSPGGCRGRRVRTIRHDLSGASRPPTRCEPHPGPAPSRAVAGTGRGPTGDALARRAGCGGAGDARTR